MKTFFLSLFLICFGISSDAIAQSVPSRVNCPMCMGGQMKMPCGQCFGNGYITQYGFGGFCTRMICGTCRGAGMFCAYCGNQGTIANPVANYPVKPLLNGGIRCAQCFGTGYWICSFCQGIIPNVYNCSFCNNGVGTCSMCAGSGTFFASTNYGGYSSGGGGYSGGSSSHGSSNYGSSSSGSSSKVCQKLSATDNAHCNGSGVCSTCNGKKYYYDSTFGNRHLVDPCVTCNGTGRCPSCNGTGRR